MANIAVAELKPQRGVLRLKNPVLMKAIQNFESRSEFDPLTEEEQIEYEQAKKHVDVFPLPDGSIGPLEIYLVGRNSKQWLDFMKEIKKMSKKGEGVDISTGVMDLDLMDRISDKSREFMASLIIGWLDNGALDAEYTPDEALELVSNAENIWLLEQMQEFVLVESNFFLTTLAM